MSALLALLSSPGWAYTPDLERRLLVLLRTLSYDRALTQRVPEAGLKIAVLYADGSATSRQQAQDVAEVLTARAGLTIGGRALVQPVISTFDAVPADAEALVLCDGLDAASLAVVSAVARERDLSTLALREDYVGAGASLGVVQRGARLEILVARKLAVEEGADLSGELLEVARLVEWSP